MKKITVVLTEAQAKEILHAAGAGYGDGDLYGLNDDGSKPQKREANSYARAMGAISRALYAHRPKSAPPKTRKK